MSKPLNVYSLHVSGGFITTHFAFLCEVYDAKKIACGGKFDFGASQYAPDIAMGSSGGNMALYLSMAADWSSDGIKDLTRLIKTEIFIRSWLPKNLSFIPSWSFGFYRGTMHRQGVGHDELFAETFTTESIQRTEIWTGTYNKTHRKAQFFCNKNVQDSLINPIFFDREKTLLNCLPLKYLSGNIHAISIVTLASASIPMLVDGQTIDGENHCDGGNMYASPLSVLSQEICRIVLNDHRVINPHKLIVCSDGRLNCVQPSLNGSSSGNEIIFEIDTKKEIFKEISEIDKEIPVQRSLRLIYFSCYDMEKSYPNDNGNGYVELGRSIKQILHCSVLHDRQNAVSLLQKICGAQSHNIEHSHIHYMNTQLLGELFKKLENVKHYVMCMYPHQAPSISITNFTHQDILDKMEEAKNSYGVYVWFLEK
jgi:hypothetical protein